MEDEEYAQSSIYSALRDKQVVGLREAELPLTMWTGRRGKGWEGRPWAGGRQVLPQALAGVSAAPATIHQMLHQTHQSKG